MCQGKAIAKPAQRSCAGQGARVTCTPLCLPHAYGGRAGLVTAVQGGQRQQGRPRGPQTWTGLLLFLLQKHEARRSQGRGRRVHTLRHSSTGPAAVCVY